MGNRRESLRLALWFTPGMMLCMSGIAFAALPERIIGMPPQVAPSDLLQKDEAVTSPSRPIDSSDPWNKVNRRPSGAAAGVLADGAGVWALPGPNDESLSERPRREIDFSDPWGRPAFRELRTTGESLAYSDKWPEAIENNMLRHRKAPRQIDREDPWSQTFAINETDASTVTVARPIRLIDFDDPFATGKSPRPPAMEWNTVPLPTKSPRPIDVGDPWRQLGVSGDEFSL